MKGYTYKTILGDITIKEEKGKIKEVSFDKTLGTVTQEETKTIKKAKTELTQYLSGERTVFSVELEPEGTEFQKAVWSALKTIPYGETRCYEEIAIQIGNPKAVRAVGMANNHNPIAIFIPCHRVIGKKGNLVGYAGGLDNKKKLLEIEKIHNMKKWEYDNTWQKNY